MLGLLQRKVVSEMTEVTRTTDSSAGVVLESSSYVKQMNDACSDDVAAARIRTGSSGIKTLVRELIPVCFGIKARNVGIFRY